MSWGVLEWVFVYSLFCSRPSEILTFFKRLADSKVTRCGTGWGETTPGGRRIQGDRQIRFHKRPQEQGDGWVWYKRAICGPVGRMGQKIHSTCQVLWIFEPSTTWLLEMAHFYWTDVNTFEVPKLRVVNGMELMILIKEYFTNGNEGYENTIFVTYHTGPIFHRLLVARPWVEKTIFDKLKS